MSQTNRGGDDDAVTPSRAATTEELLSELTRWNPRERARTFRRWLRVPLSIIHLHVLTLLEAEGPLRMTRLAEALDVSVASATGIVDRLEQRGLVERRPEPGDRRVVLVNPTDGGVAIFRDLDEHRRARLRRVLARMTDEEVTAFLTGLRAVRAAEAALDAEDGDPDERDAETAESEGARGGGEP